MDMRKFTEKSMTALQPALILRELHNVWVMRSVRSMVGASPSRPKHIPMNVNEKGES